MKPDIQAVQATAQAHAQRRAVRAVAQLGSSDTPLEWAGSQARLLVFERGMKGRGAMPPEPQPEELQVDLLPFGPLEDLSPYDPQQPALWLGQVYAHAQAHSLPLNWLAQARPLYDPAQVLAKLRRTWDGLPAGVWATVREGQLGYVGQQLAAPEPGALPALLLARRVALSHLLPALVGPRPMPLGGWRLPHYWHATFALSAPKSVALLDQLYGFGGASGSADEAARVLRSMRGLGMLSLERQARVAVQAGYSEGAVRLVRDEAARLHSTDIGRWAQLSPARRERLSTLLGLESSPLGLAALEVGAELLEAVRREMGRG